MGQHALYGMQSTLSATNEDLVIAIEENIKKQEDWKYPLLKRWNSKIFESEVTSHKYEWKERPLRPVKTQLNGAVADGNATTLVVDDAGVFNVDDKLRVQSTGEIMIVTAVNGGTNLVVERGWGGTTAGAISDNAVVFRQGTAAPQGKDADDMVNTGTENLFNYSNIYEDVVKLTGTQHTSLIHGDEKSGQLIERKQNELMEGQHVDLLLGVRYMDVLNERYTSGGLKFFIDEYASSNAIDFGGASTWNTDANVLAKLRAAVTRIAEENGEKPTIYMGWKAMDRFALIDSDKLRTTRGDAIRGVGVVDRFRSLLGDLDVVLIRERTGMMDNLIFFVDESQVGYKAKSGRAWQTFPLGRTGDNYKWQVVGEYTVKIGTPKVAAYLYNLGL